MASRIYPQVLSPIKSVQRGTAIGAGNITISTVDVNKSFVKSFSTSSAGTVASNSTTSGTYAPTGGSVGAPSSSLNNAGSFPTYSGTRSFAGGTTDLTTAKYGAYLLNSTTITSTGPCNWEVVEYL